MSKHLVCKSCGASLDVKGQRSDIIRCDYCQTDIVLEPETRAVVAKDSHLFSVRL